MTLIWTVSHNQIGSVNLLCSWDSKRQRLSSMATSTSSSSAPNQKLEIIKKIRSHEVALAELDNLSCSRAVYQKTANLFFRTTAQKAKAAEQKHLDSDRAKLGMLNSS